MKKDDPKAIQVVELRKAHPDWTLRLIGEAIDVSKQYVSNVLRDAGLKTSATNPATEENPKERRKGGVNTTWTGSGAVALAKGDIGAVTELMVCADLVRSGHDVYRAVTQSSPADIIVWANERPYRIEVKAAQVNPESGRWIHGASQKTGKFDILALVAPSGQIRYKPPIPIGVKKTRKAA